jgi:hypothetical protein
MHVRRVVAAALAVVVGASVAALAPIGPAAADVALVDVTCDLPPAGGLGGGVVPDTIVQEDLEVELVDTPDPVAQGQPVSYAVDLPVPNITDGLDLPAEFAPYGTLQFNSVLLTIPIPAGLDVASAANVTFTPSVPWLTVTKSGSNLIFKIESTVAGSSPSGKSRIRLNLDAASPVIEIEQSAGVWVSVTPLPQVTITGTATGAPGSTIDWKPPRLDVSVKYAKSVFLLLDIDWNNVNVPCVPIDPNQTITSTAIVAPAPALSVTKALAPGDDEVVAGETIDYTVTVSNTGNVPLTGVTLNDPNATCEAVATSVPVSGSDEVACTHVAAVGDVGTYSNTATADSAETAPLDSNTVNTAVVAAVPGLGVTKALAPGDDEVVEGETIDYTVTVSNTGNVPLTGVTLSDPNATCEAVATSLAVSASDDVACTHTTVEADIGTYSNTATADSAETAAVASNTVDTAVTEAPLVCLPPEFSDVPEDSQFFTEICWMVDQGITTGFPGGVFKPGNPVTRQAMAAFLHRLAGDPPPPAPCTQQFSDVPTSSQFFEDICWMVQEEITGGFPGGIFKPTGNVTRAAMAAFLYRYDGEPEFVDPLTPTFSDVPLNHLFSHEIEWMSEQGITTGFPGNTYRPSASVTRQSMAAFLFRFATD